jgi:hypothetical protein
VTGTTPPEAAAYPVLAMAVLVPEQDLPRTAPEPARHGPRVALTDPYQALVGHPPAWIDLRFTPQGTITRLDLPYADPAALYELLETLYVVEGWQSVDVVVEGAQRALAWTLLRLYPVVPLGPVRGGIPGVHYLPTPADPLAAARTLVAAVAKGWPMPVVLAAATLMQSTPQLFSQDLPQVRIAGPGIESDPLWLARAQANVVVALADARQRLETRVIRTLWRVEREAMRQLTATLTDARVAIVRETYRYFSLQQDAGAEALLASNVTARPTRTATPSAGARGPLDAEPAALKSALTELEPFAKRVRELEATPQPGTAVKAVVEQAIAQARIVLAREVGRRAQAFPVLGRLDAKKIGTGAAGNADELGAVVFAALKQCFLSNVKIRSRVATEFVGVADVDTLDPRPERALAEKVVGAGAGRSVWSLWKYVERATERIAGLDDHFTHRVLDEVAALLRQSDVPTVSAVGQAMGEVLVLGAAELAVSKLVPVLNVATATWHIATAIREFGERSDEFYCTLDPRDALVEAAPSFKGLALDIASEAFFAVL